ncbi:hypothetical protein R1flu_027268 [Riccia fluitans]|uniref:Uncharacterized protein n=1 Tax=Riccia fluitans TaxID=41844 RepID=A0ABD1XIU7_9MARC
MLGLGGARKKKCSKESFFERLTADFSTQPCKHQPTSVALICTRTNPEANHDNGCNPCRTHFLNDRKEKRRQIDGRHIASSRDGEGSSCSREARIFARSSKKE